MGAASSKVNVCEFMALGLPQPLMRTVNCPPGATRSACMCWELKGWETAISVARAVTISPGTPSTVIIEG